MSTNRRQPTSPQHGPGENGERYFFLHMQKTAGTSLRFLLERVFSPEEILPAREEKENPWFASDVDRLRERLAERGPAVRLVAGHYPLCTAELMGSDVHTFTVLRDPVERTLSLLRDRQQSSRGPDYGWPLQEIFDHPIVKEGFITNHMVKMLSLRSTEASHGMHTATSWLTEEHLERAKRALVDQVEVFGLQVEFDDFCERLGAQFGWDLGESGLRPRANVSAPVEVDDELVERIAAENRLDVELYAFATSLLARRLNAPPREPSAHRDSTDATPW